jgi:hypothetical protein
VLILKHCRVLATPKTGSTWVERACLRAVKGAKKYGGDAEYHERLIGERSDLPAIAFVRHPLQWYPSYWNHRVRHGWTESHNIDRLCASDSFSEFMDKAVRKLPGWLGQYLETWIGTQAAPAEFIGRHECLQTDLIKGLRFFNEEFDEAELLTTAATNASDDVTYPAVWSDSLIEAVCESEHELIQRFYE